ncbi:ParB/RepB/Spo0J family partition protein, partial [Acinetobacter baumannii]|nr:ParB/RepB/Spo0J family partition protein [Acinetobacter baumannii]
MSFLLDAINTNDDKPASQTSIPLSKIDLDPNNPRKYFSEKKEKDLEESIKESGVKVPVILIVNPNDPERYIVKDGNRRVKNAKRAGCEDIPASIVEAFSELDQLTANTMSEDMTFYDLSRSINRLKDQGISQRKIGLTIGFDDAKVSKFVAITKDVDESILEVLEDMVDRGLLSDFSAMYELSILARNHKVEVSAWVEKQSATAKKIGIAEVQKFKKSFETDLEKDKPKDKSVSLNDKVIEDIMVKAEGQLPLISKLSKGEIKDPDQQEEILKGLKELIKDLQLIHKQYK